MTRDEAARSEDMWMDILGKMRQTVKTNRILYPMRSSFLAHSVIQDLQSHSSYVRNNVVVQSIGNLDGLDRDKHSTDHFAWP